MNQDNLAVLEPAGAAVAARLSRNDSDPGKRLKLRREELKLNQKDVAQHMSLSRAAYCQYETGSSKLRVDQAEQVASYLETTPEWLAFGTGERDVKAAAKNVKTVSQVIFEDGDFFTVETWTLNENWLKARFNLIPSSVVLLEMPMASNTMQIGDLAIIEKGTTPSASVGEFVLVIDGELMVANVSKLVRSDTLRIHHGKNPTQDLTGGNVVVLGRVVGKLGGA